FADRSPSAAQRLAEELPIRLGERRRAVTARNELLSLLHPVREMRRRDVEQPHASMQPLERTGVVGWRDLSRRFRGSVVGPQRDREAITFVDARIHPRLKNGYRAPGFGKPLRKLDFEPRDLLRDGGYPGKHLTRQQAHGVLVRVLQNDR